MKTRRRVENIAGVMFVIEKMGSYYNAHWIKRTGEEVQNVYKNFKSIKELKLYIYNDMTVERQLEFFLEETE